MEQQRLYGLQDAADAVGVNYWRLYHAHRHGGLAEPAKTYGNRRIYTDADIERLKQHFGTASKGADR